MPGLGSLDRLSTRAKRSRQLPTAMSIVSPKMRYRLSEYAITCIPFTAAVIPWLQRALTDTKLPTGP